MSPIHGLRYEQNFLDDLPVLVQRPEPHMPIRGLSAEQFADMHFTHMTSDVNDAVLFPFLHGLEGDNHAQNTFFAGSGGLCRAQEARGAVHVPRYRGLIWVAADDDLGDFDNDDDDFDCDFEDSDVNEDHHMSCDDVRDDNPIPHMHPETMRKPIPINTDHDRRPSVSSITTSASSASHYGFSTSFSTSSSLPSPNSSCPSPCADIAMDDSIPPAPSPSRIRKRALPQLTSSFVMTDLLTMDMDDSPMFVPPLVPDGISLRNFGIQVSMYATISDIVIYSRSGDVKNALMDESRGPLALARRFKLAIERKLGERIERYKSAGVEAQVNGKDEDTENDELIRSTAELVPYNVFVLTDPVDVLMEKAPWLMCWPRTLGETDMDGCGDLFGTLDRGGQNAQLKMGVVEEDAGPVVPMTSTGDTNPSAGDGGNATTLTANQNSQVIVPPMIDFAQRERDEMRELTKASPVLSDCIWLGNSGDVPVPSRSQRPRHKRVVLNGSPHDRMYDSDSDEDDPFDGFDNPGGYDLCIDCRDGAPIPSAAHIRQAESHLATLDALWSARCFAEACQTQQAFSPILSSPPRYTSSPSTPTSASLPTRSPRPPPRAAQILHLAFPASPPANSYSLSAMVSFLNFLSSLVNPHQNPPSTRQKRILIYSCDGYTESSVLALCILMKERGLDLPSAYLELQVEKGRSFFVYQPDLAVLKRIESRLGRDRDMSSLYTRVHFGGMGGQNNYSSSSHWHNTTPRTIASSPYSAAHSDKEKEKEKNGWTKTWSVNSSSHLHTRASSMSMLNPPPFSSSLPSSSPAQFSLYGSDAQTSFPSTPPPEVVPSQVHNNYHHLNVRRPRASTSPLLPHFLDHQAWFNDPRFDGSFPSRVLPFLYLGNLNHASNAYMLHALGITHVVSVGECALVPPANIATDNSSSGYHFVAGKGPGGHGSLWMEEREGRINVLDIKGVCDDGIDSLQPQLAPVCDWIDRAREEGGKVLVHCRVGVSRSATVTIAYVMKHLGISLVDAYLIVRSRRLSVLIQPNMRLLYNLCGWEVHLARERAEGDVTKLLRELAHSLNWPYLSREVHRLNEKYLS